MKASFLGATTGALLLGSTTAALADPITITLDRRTVVVLAHTTDAGVDDRHPAMDSAKDVLTATATARAGLAAGASSSALASSISNPMHLSGIGVANATWAVGPNLADFSAASDFVVDLLLTSPFSYQFDMAFDAVTTATDSLFGGGIGRTIASLTRFNGPTSDFFFNETLEDGAGTRTFSGVLAPGLYHLFLEAGAVGSFMQQGGTAASHAAFDFTFNLTPAQSDPVSSPTPEPASLLLLGAGALAASRAWRR